MRISKPTVLAYLNVFVLIFTYFGAGSLYGLHEWIAATLLLVVGYGAIILSYVAGLRASGEKIAGIDTRRLSYGIITSAIAVMLLVLSTGSSFFGSYYEVALVIGFILALFGYYWSVAAPSYALSEKRP